MRVVPVVLVFAATLAIVFLIGWVIDRRRQAFVASQGEDGERVTEPSLAFPQTRLHLPWLKALTEKTGLARPLELKLNRAAIPLRPVEFVALTYFLTAVFFSAGAFLIREFWAVALLGWVGYRAPTWLLNFLAARRKALLERQLARPPCGSSPPACERETACSRGFMRSGIKCHLRLPRNSSASSGWCTGA